MKTLKKKYNKNIEQLIEFRDEAAGELEKLESIPANLKKLDTEIESEKLKMAALAVKMHDARKAAARQLEKSVNNELSELGMSGVAFAILVENEEDEQNGLPVSENMEAWLTIKWNRYNHLLPFNQPGNHKNRFRTLLLPERHPDYTAVKNSCTDGFGTIMIFDEIDIGRRQRRSNWKKLVTVTPSPDNLITPCSDCRFCRSTPGYQGCRRRKEYQSDRFAG